MATIPLSVAGGNARGVLWVEWALAMDIDRSQYKLRELVCGLVLEQEEENAPYVVGFSQGANS